MIYKTTRWGYYLMDGTKNDDQEVYIANSSEADKALLNRARRGDRFKSGSLIGATMGWLAGLGASGSAATASFVHIGPHVGTITNAGYVVTGCITSIAALASVVSTAIYGRMATQEVRTALTNLPDATCFTVYGKQWVALRKALHAIDTGEPVDNKQTPGKDEHHEEMPVTWHIMRFSLRNHNHLGKCLDPYVTHYLRATAPLMEANHESLSEDRKDKIRAEINRLAESTATQIFPLIEPVRDVQEFETGQMVTMKDYERLRHRGEANAKADAVLQTSQLVN